MIILGISESHTCTAALSVDGEIVAAVSEERLSRRKGEMGFPEKAISYCLQHIPSHRKLDRVCLSVNALPPYTLMISRAHKFNIRDHINAQHEYFKPMLIGGDSNNTANRNYFGPLIENADLSETNYLWDRFKPSFHRTDDIEKFREIRFNTIVKYTGIDRKDIIYNDHHKCHAAYAYYASPFRKKDALVLTMDGIGDGVNCTVSVVKNDKINEILRTDKCTIGKHWRYITLLLGMKPEEHEYKVMGLAPYAKEYMSKEVESIFNEHLIVDNIDFKYKSKPTDLYFYYKEILEGHRFDAIAGGLQSFTEKIIQEWVANCVNHTNIRRVVFSGGVAMNIKVNKVVAEMPEVEEFFVAPSGGDESLALGTCFFENAKNDINNKPLQNIYIGPFFSDNEIEMALQGHQFKIIRNVTNKELAQFLAEGNIIARCVGKMGFGARALGNRSIIANPSKWETVEKINDKIKFRDFWMPFTPTILSDRIKDYVCNPKGFLSPYMTIAFNTTDLAKRDLKAAIHPKDKTIRPQVLEKEHNPEYYDLIKEFEKITGIGGLLNTSLNLHGEPVVCSPVDAVHTFVNSELDILLINNYLICREHNHV